MKFRTSRSGYRQFNTGSGWQYTHRAVAAKTIGHQIPLGYHVHHRNGVKTDNRPANLSVLPANVHKTIHSK